MNTLKARLLSGFVLFNLLLAALPASSVHALARIIRVSATPPIGPIGPIFRRCGGTWDTACGLQQALNMAVAGDTLWVAEGTYKPTTTSDRTLSFILKSGVAVYGGFAGDETALDQRDPVNNLTILSGDIGSTLSRYDNSYHVVVSSGTDSTTVLDGVTITGGQSDGVAASNYDKGAGLLNIGGSPTLNNITFSANHTGNAYGDGAGMYSTGDPTITHAVFSGNETGSYGHGGGMYSFGDPLIMDVTFRDNWACGGGGLYSEGTPIVTNVTFSGNEAANGAGMYNYGDAGLTNVTFSGNIAMYSGGGLETGSSWDLSYPNLTNVTFTGNSVTSTTSGKGGAINGYNNHIVIHNSILWGNTAASGPEIYQQGNQSVNIIYSVVAGGCPAGGICAYIYTANPQLGPLGNYGGFTQTIPLLPGSIAIDQALNASCPYTDQRGVDRPQGKRCDVGAYEVLGPVKPGTYDDTHPAWTYTGTWVAAQGTGTYNNTLHRTRTRGSYAEVTFYGVQVQLMYLTGPDRGVIAVSIDDGKYVGTIDANTLMNSQATWRSPVWDMGVHTVRFEIAGRGWIDMDAIQVFEPDRIPPGDVTGFNAAPGTTDGSVNLSWIAPPDDAGNNVSGPVAAYLVKYSTTPFVSWSDGTVITAGLPTPATPGSAQIMTVSGLNPGTLYYFAIRAKDKQGNLSLNYATANAIAKVSTSVGPGTYDDTHANWIYSSGYLTYTDSNTYGGSAHYSDMVGEYAEFTFVGSQFTLIYSAFTNRGTVDVYIDGSSTKVATIDEYSAARVWQARWTSGDLGAGQHTVKLVHASGMYVDIDAIEIAP